MKNPLKTQRAILLLFSVPRDVPVFLRLIIDFCCDPAGTRTQDPYIKSVMLYQLSYGIWRQRFRNLLSLSPETGFYTCFRECKNRVK